MERAQEFLSELNDELEENQKGLGRLTKGRSFAFSHQRIMDYQEYIEKILNRIIIRKRKIEAVKVYIAAVQSLRGYYWSDSDWATLKSAENNLESLGIKGDCVKYTNVWD